MQLNWIYLQLDCNVHDLMVLEFADKNIWMTLNLTL